MTTDGAPISVPAADPATTSTGPVAPNPVGTLSASSAAARTSAWLFGVLAAGYLILFLPSLQNLHARWIKMDEAYAHGYLVVAMVAYFAWLQRDRLASAPQQPSLIWLPVLAAMSAGWGLSQIVDIQLVGTFALPLLALVAVHIMGGRAITSIAAFPLLMLYISVPFWEDVFGWTLRTVTAIASSIWLEQFAQFPVSIDGYMISIPQGTFHVADGCSGLSFFLTGITIALAYGYLNFNTIGKRIAYLGICIALSVVSNWVRVTALVYVGHYSNMQSSLITEGHLLFGWYIFMGVMVIMLFIGYRMSDPLPALQAAPDVPTSGDASRGLESSLAADTHNVAAAPSRPQPRQLRALLLTLLMLAVGPALLLSFRYTTVPPEPAPSLPEGFSAVGANEVAWLPHYQHYSSMLVAVAEDEANLQLTVVHYASQTQTAELVSDLNRIDEERVWDARGESTITAQTVNALTHPLLETRLQSPSGQQILVWHWNKLGAYSALGRTTSKLAQLRARVMDGRADAALIAVSLPCLPNCDVARATLAQRVPALMQGIDGQFQQSHAQ